MSSLYEITEFLSIFIEDIYTFFKNLVTNPFFNRLPFEMKLEEFTSKVLPVKDKLYRFSLSIVNSVAEAEDVVQEVFIKLWNNKQSLTDIKNFDAWCMTLTKNLSLDKLRSKHHKMGFMNEGFDIATNSITPYQQTEINDTVDRIGVLIKKLPPKQQQIIHLRDIEGLSYQEIADSLNLSLDQIKVNLFRARKQIRAQLINSETYGLSSD